ncbi:MAG: hypothetical protein O2807_12595, partial [bacterium]|nr:hypothetical protein [bacterium]
MGQGVVPDDGEVRADQVSRLAWIFASVVAVAWSVFQLATSYFGVLPLLQQRPIHMAFGFTLIFILFPTSRASGGWGRGLGLVIDVALIAATFILGAYMAWNHIEIVWRMGAYE